MVLDGLFKHSKRKNESDFKLNTNIAERLRSDNILKQVFDYILLLIRGIQCYLKNYCVHWTLLHFFAL